MMRESSALRAPLKKSVCRRGVISPFWTFIPFPNSAKNFNGDKFRKGGIMDKTLSFVREKHLYRRDDFEEICKDAMRFFSGTGIMDFTNLSDLADDPSVYAIYPVAMEGKYQLYGRVLNRTEFRLPIYIGFSIPVNHFNGTTSSFSELAMSRQLLFWIKLISSTSGLSLSDFRIRAMAICSAAKALCLHRKLVERYHPAWNVCMGNFASKETLLRIWRFMHSRTCPENSIGARSWKLFDKELRALS